LWASVSLPSSGGGRLSGGSPGGDFCGSANIAGKLKRTAEKARTAVYTVEREFSCPFLGIKKSEDCQVFREAASLWDCKNALFIRGLGEEMLSRKMAIVFF
jgi:hypothetical protein